MIRHCPLLPPSTRLFVALCSKRRTLPFMRDGRVRPPRFRLCPPGPCLAMGQPPQQRSDPPASPPPPPVPRGAGGAVGGEARPAGAPGHRQGGRRRRAQEARPHDLQPREAAAGRRRPPAPIRGGGGVWIWGPEEMGEEYTPSGWLRLFPRRPCQYFTPRKSHVPCQRGEQILDLCVAITLHLLCFKPLGFTFFAGRTATQKGCIFFSRREGCPPQFLFPQSSVPPCGRRRCPGLPADRCVVIEDSLVGLRAAKAAGMRCVVTYTASTKDQDFFAEGAAQGPPFPQFPPPFLLPRTLWWGDARAGFRRRPSLTFHNVFRRISLHFRRPCFHSGVISSAHRVPARLRHRRSS